MAIPDYYQTLGVAERATTDEIKTAYRKLAKQYHPDRNAGDKAAEEKFKLIQSANDVLSDATKRQEYDQMRRYGGTTSGGGNWEDAFRTARGGGGGGNFEDLFGGGGGLGDLFGGRFGRGGGARTEPRQTAQVTLTFEQMATGGETTITLPSGRLTAVSLPAGLHDGDQVRVQGSGGEPDTILQIRVAPNRFFRRRGEHDVEITLPLNLAQAVLGSKVRVRTLTGGKAELRVPPGTGHDAALRMRGLGIHRTGESPGDMYVTFDLKLPTDLTDEARQAFEAFAKAQNLRH